MAFSEEIIAKLGLDNTPLTKGLRGATGVVTKWAGGLKAQIAGAFTFGAIIGGLKKALAEAEKISLAAQSLDVSTDFLQDIRNIGIASNISGEQIEKALDKFRRGLPEGANLEKEFFKFADGLAAIKDQGERARLAVDKFGERLGARLLPILQQGSAGVRQMASEFEKFSGFDIKQLEKAEAQLDQLSNRVTVAIGKFLAMADDTATVQKEVERLNRETAGDGTHLADRQRQRLDAQKKAKLELLELSKKFRERLIKEAEPAEQLAALEKERAEAAKTRAKDNKEVFERANKLLDIDIRAKDLKEKIERAEEKITAEKKKQADLQSNIAAAERNLANAREDAAVALSERSRFTLQELLDLGNDGTRLDPRALAKKRTAQQIARLEFQARDRTLFNDPIGADKLTQKALDLRRALGDVLVSSDADPLAGVTENTAKSAAVLEEILLKSSKGGEGLTVTPRSD